MFLIMKSLMNLLLTMPPRAERDAYSKNLNDYVDVTCLMLTTMNFEL